MNDEQQTYKEQGCDDEPPSEEIVEEPSRERDGHDHEHPSKSMFQQWRELKIDRRIESSVAVLGLIIGIIVAYIALNQLNAMNDQTKAMKGQLEEMIKGSADTKTLAESAKTQADNTKKLADATESLAETTRSSVAQGKIALDATIEASHMEQRAWVGVKTLNLIAFKPGETVKGRAVFRNTGHTPALNVTTQLNSQSSRTPIDIDKSAIELSKPIMDKIPYALFPNDESIADVDFVMTPTNEHIDDVMKGRGYLYLFGEIHYEDVFKRSHTTEFCGIFSPQTLDMMKCKQHNRAN